MGGNEEGWGPWIPFSGVYCPFKVGQWVYLETTIPFSNTQLKKCEGRVTHKWFSWPHWCRVNGYRIRKPKGLTMLQDIARKCDTDLIMTPEKEGEKV